MDRVFGLTPSQPRKVVLFLPLPAEEPPGRLRHEEEAQELEESRHSGQAQHPPPALVEVGEGPADQRGRELAGHHQRVVADSEGAAQRGRGRLG